MLNEVKNALRVKSSSFDGEIEGIIEACKADLSLVGIQIQRESQSTKEGEPPKTETDPLVVRAVILYAKAHFGFSEDSEKYQKAYDYLKLSLSLAGEYSGVER